MNGQANCNRAMHERLTQTQKVRPLHMRPTRVRKLTDMLANAWALLRHGRTEDMLYVSVPGQRGAWLLLPTIWAARARGMVIWFHYHSYRPINRAPYAPVHALVACAGPRQNHILLSQRMRDRFAEHYLAKGTGLAHVLSNSFLFPPAPRAPMPRPNRPLTIGHLSVLTREKGVPYLLDLFERARQTVPNLRLVIAGPTEDEQLAALLYAMENRFGGAMEWRGPVRSEEKERFYDDIDLFILPTTLVDEAEPLVILEAYSAGVDVMASSTGCIPDRIRDFGMLLSLDLASDTPLIEAVARLDGNAWAQRRDACRLHVRAITRAVQQSSCDTLARLAVPSDEILHDVEEERQLP